MLRLERTEFLQQAVPCLAKRFNVPKEELWNKFHGGKEQIIINEVSIDNCRDRHQVNKWWTENRKNFNRFNLGRLLETKKVSRLPEPTYAQIMALMWLTAELNGGYSRLKKKMPGQPRRSLPQKYEVTKPPVKTPRIKIFINKIKTFFHKLKR
jgi:hypothetical protein